MVKIILYIAMSLDGFIARKNRSVDWLDKFNNTGEDFGYQVFFDSVGTVIVGNTTYEQFPEGYKGKDCFVFSKKSKETKDNITFVNTSPKEFVKSLKTKDGKDIWLVGGANLANQFLKERLIDEMIITIIPTVLGEGIKLFYDDNKELPLKVKNVESYKSDVVQIHYALK